jgi:hypothetical protein
MLVRIFNKIKKIKFKIKPKKISNKFKIMFINLNIINNHLIIGVIIIVIIRMTMNNKKLP